jgi:hypothetical protein
MKLQLSFFYIQCSGHVHSQLENFAGHFLFNTNKPSALCPCYKFMIFFTNSCFVDTGAYGAGYSFHFLAIHRILF